jgi:hypothetical protein
MSILSLLVEHWQTVLGIAILVVGIVICVRCDVDFTAVDGPFRRR